MDTTLGDLGYWMQRDVDDLRERWDGGATLEAISRRLGRTQEDVLAKAKELGLSEYIRNKKEG
jgi:hypothetical protein